MEMGFEPQPDEKLNAGIDGLPENSRSLALERPPSYTRLKIQVN
jgi:hypothetical protein